jgi:hypothetical protein
MPNSTIIAALLGLAAGFVLGRLKTQSYLGSGSGPQIPQFEFVDPKWDRIPSMMYPEGSPNFIGRDHWNMPRTSKPPVQ